MVIHYKMLLHFLPIIFTFSAVFFLSYNIFLVFVFLVFLQLIFVRSFSALLFTERGNPLFCQSFIFVVSTLLKSSVFFTHLTKATCYSILLLLVIVLQNSNFFFSC